jgi:lysophospholipid acyltransferase (LPLAT)-like uncharacterized protein
VLALWHGQMLPLLTTHRDSGIAVLISEHRDGEIIARVAKAFGVGTVRGSTSRGGSRALLEMVAFLRRGGEVAITPDGPRGPRHRFAPGALVAAHRAGVPVVGMAAHADRAWRLRSWDVFEIPKPFAASRSRTPRRARRGASARDAAAQADAFEARMGELTRVAAGARRAGAARTPAEPWRWTSRRWRSASGTGRRRARVAALALAPARAALPVGRRRTRRALRPGALASHALGLPALSVGNLTVGGTGKTPVAAWLVGSCSRAARVRRSSCAAWAGDESRVHALLNPGAPWSSAPTVWPGRARRARAAPTWWCSTTRSSTGARGATWTWCWRAPSARPRRCGCCPPDHFARRGARCGAPRPSA